MAVNNSVLVTGACEAMGLKVLDNPKNISLSSDAASLEGR